MISVSINYHQDACCDNKRQRLFIHVNIHVKAGALGGILSILLYRRLFLWAVLESGSYLLS